MKFKRITFSWTSIMIGVHIGKNPVSGQGFMHIGLLPFIGLDFEMGERVEIPREVLVVNDGSPYADRIPASIPPGRYTLVPEKTTPSPGQRRGGP